MVRKVRWGVLGVAKIATEKVIPAMQRGELSEIAAIASRDLEKAQTVAQRLGIAKAYGSYEELIADPEIEAVYIPVNPLRRGGQTRAVRKADRPLGYSGEGTCRSQGPGTGENR